MLSIGSVLRCRGSLVVDKDSFSMCIFNYCWEEGFNLVFSFLATSIRILITCIETSLLLLKIYRRKQMKISQTSATVWFRIRRFLMQILQVFALITIHDLDVTNETADISSSESFSFDFFVKAFLITRILPAIPHLSRISSGHEKVKHVTQLSFAPTDVLHFMLLSSLLWSAFEQNLIKC